MSFSTDTIVRAWASTHDAPVEEAFSDFLVVGLSTEDVKARVPYVVQVDGTVAFGDAEPVTIEYVEMSDLTPSERVDLAVGEVGAGSTIVALTGLQSKVSSYVRRSKSGKAIRVKSYFRMIDAKDLMPGEVVLDRHNRRRVVDKVNGNVVTFKGGGKGTGQFSVATPNYVSGKAAKNTVVKDIKPAFNPQKQQPGKIAKALAAVKRELVEGDDGAIAGKDFSPIDLITGRRWDAEGYPKGTRARHTPQSVEVEQSRPTLTSEQQAMATGIGKTGPSARRVGGWTVPDPDDPDWDGGRSLPPKGDYPRSGDVKDYTDDQLRESIAGLEDAASSGIQSAQDRVRDLENELVRRSKEPVSAAPFPSKAVPASDLKADDLIDLDGNVRLVKSATPAGNSVLLSTTTPRGGDVQNSVVKKTSMVKKLTVALVAVLLAIGAGNAGEHFETDYHPHEESISQMVEGRGIVGINAPGNVSNPGFRITTKGRRSQKKVPSDLTGMTDAELDALEADIRKRGQGANGEYQPGSLRDVVNARRVAVDDVEYIVEDDPTAVEARKLVGKVTTDGGFTYNPRTSTYVEHGFAVAMPGNSVIIKDADFTGEAAVDAVIKYLDEHEDKVFSNGRIQIGGWHDTEHGEVVLDLSEIFEDMIEAMRAGAERDEQAIFDLDTFTEIPTGGTGGRVDLSMLVDEYLALVNGSTPLSTSNYAWEEGA